MSPKWRFDPLDDMLALLTIDERVPRGPVRLGVNRQVGYISIYGVGWVPEGVELKF